MPHSTFLGSSLQSIQQQQHHHLGHLNLGLHHDQQQQQQQQLLLVEPPSEEAGSEYDSSSSPSSSTSSPASASPLRPSSPVLAMTAAPVATSSFFRLSTLPTGKRSMASKHMRSKSSNTPSSLGITSLSGASSFHTSSPRQYAPPLIRSNSLPPVSTFGELRSRYTLANIPTSPTTRRQGPRSNSPTRQWAYSQSPLGIPRGSGGFYPPSPTLSQPPPPPAYLVNEPFIPSAYSSANSSSPSTPTSTRSRSPSISSLDTIPDSPDAEEEALEVEMKEALDRAAAKSLSSSPLSETDEDESNSGGRRSSMDGSRDNFGAGRRGAADKRKRWSVCGGEKRGDLELETIWEEAFGGGNNGGPDPLGIMNGDGMGDGEMI